jgi:hypothetical protein
MSPLAWRAYLGAGALAAGVVLALPVAPRAVLLVAVGASAALAIAAGVRGHRPAGGGAWWLLAAGQGLFVLGDVLFTVNDLVLHIEPFPSLADALYLAGYPVLAGGLALLLRRRSATRDRPALLDAAIIATGFGLISWVLAVVPYFRDLEQTLLELVVSLAYPVGRAAAGAGRRPRGRRRPAHDGLLAAGRHPGRRHRLLGPGAARRRHRPRRRRLRGRLRAAGGDRPAPVHGRAVGTGGGAARPPRRRPAAGDGRWWRRRCWSSSGCRAAGSTPSSTTGRSSGSPRSPTSWSTPSSSCSAPARRRGPGGSSAPRPRCRPRCRARAS